ncbi:hypothetical protein PIB30_001707 [Stylosanthes scabra]|uniref:Uncharacterized protein n=1 Tax=Stylosanthes scabra TaxID=79078 RepID=A0ABU6U1J4_9FABA|nr:hypothetical protein [Stylosanthes scabra]
METPVPMARRTMLRTFSSLLRDRARMETQAPSPSGLVSEGDVDAALDPSMIKTCRFLIGILTGHGRTKKKKKKKWVAMAMGQREGGLGLGFCWKFDAREFAFGV